MEKKKIVVDTFGKKTEDKPQEGWFNTITNLLANSSFKEDTDEILPKIKLVVTYEPEIGANPDFYQNAIELAKTLIVLRGDNVRISSINEKTDISKKLAKILEETLIKEFDKGWGDGTPFLRSLTIDEIKEVLEHQKTSPTDSITDEKINQLKSCGIAKKCDTNTDSLRHFICDCEAEQNGIKAYYNKVKNIKPIAIALCFLEFKSKLTNQDKRTLFDCLEALGLINDIVQDYNKKYRGLKSAMNRAKEGYANRICEEATKYELIIIDKFYYLH